MGHSQSKFIAIALIFAMVMTCMMMPDASASSVNSITDAPTIGEVGIEYVYNPIINPGNEWAGLSMAGAATVTIAGAPWLSYDTADKTFSGTPTIAGTYSILVALRPVFGVGGEVVNSWTVEVVESIPFAFTSSLGVQDPDYPDEYELVLLVGHEDVITYEPSTNYPADINFFASPMPSWLVWEDGVLTISGSSSAGGLWVTFEAVRISDSNDVVEQSIYFSNQPFKWAEESIFAGYNDIYFVGEENNIQTPIIGDGIATIVSGPEWTLGLETYPSHVNCNPLETGTFNITVKGVSSINPDWEIYGDFNITVWNPIQFLSANPSMTIAVGQTWSYTPATSNDPFAVIGTYNMPDWISYNSATKTFTGTPTEAGSYSPLVIYAQVVSSAGTLAETTQEIYLTVVDDDSGTIAPVADYQALSGQSAMSISFTDLSSDATAYLWSFGDGTTSTVTSPYHSYQSPGVYNVTLNVANAAGSDSKTVQVNVGIETIPPAVVTKGQLYSFTPANVGRWMPLIDEESIVSVQDCAWLTYNASIGTFTGTPTVVGSYNVTVTLDAADVYGGTRDISWTIQVMEAMPIAAFTLNAASGIAPFTVYFLDASINAQTYLWSFGDGTTSTVRQSPHTYWNAGYYDVSLTVTNAVGSDTYVETIHVSAAATTVYHDQSAPKTGKVGVLYQYAPNITLNGEWSMLQNTIVAANIIISGASWLDYNITTGKFSGTPATAGNYDVRVSIYLPFYGEKVNGWTITVTEQEAEPEPEDPADLVPLAAFVCSKISGVAPLNVSFIDYSARATSWSWNFGDGIGSIEKDVNHSYAEAGTYNVTLTVNNEHGNDTYTRVITVTAALAEDVEEDDNNTAVTEIELLEELKGSPVAMGMTALGILCLSGAIFIRRPLPAIVGVLLLIAVYLLLEGWWAI